MYLGRNCGEGKHGAVAKVDDCCSRIELQPQDSYGMQSTVPETETSQPGANCAVFTSYVPDLTF